MSDNWIRLIPEDPHFVPVRERQAQAKTLFADSVAGRDGVQIENCDEITLFDCGGNFECIRCPSCRVELPIEWWWDRVEEERAQGFPFAPRELPCCAARKHLNELAYEWPQGFARFALSAMNPQIGRIDDRLQQELEGVLGTKLRVIYQHL